MAHDERPPQRAPVRDRHAQHRRPEDGRVPEDHREDEPRQHRVPRRVVSEPRAVRPHARARTPPAASHAYPASRHAAASRGSPAARTRARGCPLMASERLDPRARAGRHGEGLGLAPGRGVRRAEHARPAARGDLPRRVHLDGARPARAPGEMLYCHPPELACVGLRERLVRDGEGWRLVEEPSAGPGFRGPWRTRTPARGPCCPGGRDCASRRRPGAGRAGPG